MQYAQPSTCSPFRTTIIARSSPGLGAISANMALEIIQLPCNLLLFQHLRNQSNYNIVFGHILEKGDRRLHKSGCPTHLTSHLTCGIKPTRSWNLRQMSCSHHLRIRTLHRHRHRHLREPRDRTEQCVLLCHICNTPDRLILHCWIYLRRLNQLLCFESIHGTDRISGDTFPSISRLTIWPSSPHL
jgi:hypothetical protein